MKCIKVHLIHKIILFIYLFIDGGTLLVAQLVEALR